jgi:integrase
MIGTGPVHEQNKWTRPLTVDKHQYCQRIGAHGNTGRLRIIDLLRSKTDQESSGRKVGIPFGKGRETCPVRALRRWLKAARITSGPLFRSVNRHGRVAERGLHKDSVGAILKTAAQRARMKTEPLAGHSLRAGCVTQAAMNGVNECDIMRQTGHKSSTMLAKYIRIGQMFTHNAAAGLGI